MFIDSRIIVDCDPHGIQIMLCYQHGSKSNAYQGALMCPTRSLTWSGLHPSNLHLLNPKDLIELTFADYAKILKMIRIKSVVSYIDVIRKELKIMMHCGYKAEMQSLTPMQLMEKSFM